MVYSRRMDALKTWIQQNSSYRKLGDQMGITHTTVMRWIHSGRVPAERVHMVSKVTKIPPSKLRPDLFGPDARKVQLPGTTKAAFPQPSGR